jgi:hypothetical protein
VSDRSDKANPHSQAAVMHLHCLSFFLFACAAAAFSSQSILPEWQRLAGGQVAAETGDDFTTEKSSGTEITGS